MIAAFMLMPWWAEAQQHKHMISTELGVGYSSLLSNSTISNDMGLVGANLQLGYEWNWKQLLVHTGVEFASVNNFAKINDVSLSTPYTIGLPPTIEMVQHFAFSDFVEHQYQGLINIPVMVGGLFDERYYFLAGVKLGIPVYSFGKSSATVETSLSDPTLIGELGGNVPAHDVMTTTETAQHQLVHSFTAQASAEVGVNINGFLKKKKGRSALTANSRNKQLPRNYRVGVFCDYGITPSLPVVSQPLPAIAKVEQPRDINIYSHTALGTKSTPLLVGVKCAILFQVNRPKKVKQPASYLEVFVQDQETQQPINAQLMICDRKTNRQTIRQTSNGKLRYRTKVGSFDVTASAADYYSEKQSYSITTPGEKVQLDFALQHRPYFKLSVTDAQTAQALAADVVLINKNTNQDILRLTTDSATGYLQQMLDDTIQYSLMISKVGYESYTTDISTISDYMQVQLHPIKKGSVIVFKNMYFATSQTTILPESEEALNRLYQILVDNSEIRIRIIGHTDDVGTDGDNQILSEGRAQSIRQAMIDRGINPTRIEIEGRGEKEPIDTNLTEEGRANNRRVEILVL